jgi:hypothetical protein
MVAEASFEIRERERETLLRLARAGEFRDAGTGNHLVRMARYSRLIADGIGLAPDEAETIELGERLADLDLGSRDEGPAGVRDDTANICSDTLRRRPRYSDNGEHQQQRRGAKS